MLVVSGCSKPEPQPTNVHEQPDEPTIAAPEIEYVDPLEAARAEAKSGDPADASWREGFDHREPGDSADPAGPPEPAVADQAPDPNAAAELATSTPPPELEPTPIGPLPSIGGLPPRDPEAVAKRPPDAMPPGR